MASVVLMLHHERDDVLSDAIETAKWLQEEGYEVRLSLSDATRMGMPDLARPDRELAAGSDVAVSLGGDGTMLHTVDLVAGAGVPVIGVNYGQLGYLTEIAPDEIRSALARFFAGEYDIEARMMLEVSIDAPSGSITTSRARALNEAVLEKTYPGRTVRLEVLLDAERFASYAADGLIVASPTGSTAYAFSARGPIIEPTHRAVLLTPVSPHMLFDRSLVLEPGTEVRIAVASDRAATLTIDGSVVGDLEQGDAVVCRASETDARLVTFGRRDFHRILRAKFRLTDR